MRISSVDASDAVMFDMEAVVDQRVLRVRCLGCRLPTSDTVTQAALLALLDIAEASNCVERISVSLDVNQFADEGNACLICKLLGLGFEVDDALCTGGITFYLRLTPRFEVIEPCFYTSSDAFTSTSAHGDGSAGEMSEEEREDWQWL